MATNWNQRAYNHGQRDGSRGEYKNPHNNSAEAALGMGTFDRTRSEAYDKGYANGKENPSSDKE